MYVWVAKKVRFSEISLGVLHQADEIAVEAETGVPHTQLNILEANAVGGSGLRLVPRARPVSAASPHVGNCVFVASAP